ncbi:hypothetical protein B0T22DRAFT_437252 [Podospora appendiculata]|uniref:Uncharacterized protein n=1 Tax=Podospora appendiculata TaxID=314037 RepID=A0AAE1CH66_9PEZI|nr:hypothetical protein B0T22DRAFT_437252 [Podospora appendiculata]
MARLAGWLVGYLAARAGWLSWFGAGYLVTASHRAHAGSSPERRGAERRANTYLLHAAAATAAMAVANSNGSSSTPTPPSPARRPFTGLVKELSTQLTLEPVPIRSTQSATATTRNLLRAVNPDRPFLPGQPRVRLDDDGQREADGDTKNELLEYLRKAHLTTELDDILPFMRYIFVQTPSFKHIMPLHHQKAHARDIIVVEKPGLHLVWYYDRIFIMPIPAYFYSTAFWVFLEQAEPTAYKAAVGFMRGYYYLIQYQVDFDKACAIGLIPVLPDGTNKHPTYEQFYDFIAPFCHVDDASVSRRYHYGELRLTRINRTYVLFKFRLAYFHIYPQWGSFLAHLLAPIITVFAVCSVVLNSMQVSLAALSSGPVQDAWPSLVSVSLYFPIAVIVLIAVVIVAALCGMFVKGIADLIWVNKTRKRKEAGDPDAGEKSHGVIW